MNRSLDAFGGSLQPPHRSNNTAASAAPPPPVMVANSVDSVRHVCAPLVVSSPPQALTTVFNELVPTCYRNNNREDSAKQLGILVATGVGGPSGHSNFIRVRLTDPLDPFFLFVLDLLEDDYGRFKKDHQLHVDFHEFPQALAQMLEDVRDYCSGSVVDRSLMVDRKLLLDVTANNAGTFVIQEMTAVKTTNVLVLQLGREGDVGQKKYLAEQFDYFLKSCLESEEQRRNQAMNLERAITELQRQLQQAALENDDLSSKVKLDATQADAAHQKILLERQEEHAKEVRSLRVAFDEERNVLQKKLDELQMFSRETASTKDTDIGALQARVSALEASESSLKEKLSLKTASFESLSSETQQLQDQVRQLLEFKSSAQRALSETGIHNVQLTERLNAAERNLGDRISEAQLLRAQAANDLETVHLLTDQIKERNQKLATLEADLNKAHHIIGNQMQRVKKHKEDERELEKRLAQEGDRVRYFEQRTLEQESALARATEETQHARQSVQQLKEQVQSLVDANSKLEQDLKASRDALVAMQRQGMHSLRPHMNSYTTGGSSAQDLMRQYATSATTTLSGGGGGGGGGAAAGGIHTFVAAPLAPSTATTALPSSIGNLNGMPNYSSSYVPGGRGNLYSASSSSAPTMSMGSDAFPIQAGKASATLTSQEPPTAYFN